MTPEPGVVDARDRFPGTNEPTMILMDPVDVADLERLRILERTLQTPILNLIYVVVAAEDTARKLAEHERRGYEHIKVGAFAHLRAAVARLNDGPKGAA